MTMIEEKFIERVYKASFYVSVLILSFLMMTKMTTEAAGFALGVVISLAGLRSVEAVVRRIIVPGVGHVAAKAKMGAFGVVKYFFLAVIIAMIVRSGWFNLLAFACGVGVPASVIFLKALGHYFRDMELSPFWGNHIDPYHRVREFE
jgi:hypothetical protein